MPRDPQLPRRLTPDVRTDQEQVYRFRLQSVLSPGGSATANLVLWESNNEQFIDTSAVETIRDFHDKSNGGVGVAYGQNYGLIGEVFKCRHNKDTNQYETIGSQGLHRFGKTNGAVVAGAQVTVEVYHSPNAAGCAGSDSGETVSACAKVDIADNTDVEIVYHPEFKNWFVLSPQVNNVSTAHILRATLSSNMCSTDATGSIGSVEFLSGWLGATPTTAVNGLKLAGTTNDVLYAVYRPSTVKWEILNVQHVRNEYLEKMVEPSEVTTADITSIDAGQDPADPGCDYKFRRLATPMIKEPIGAGSCVQEAFDEINFTPQAVLTDLRYGQDASGNPCIDGKVKIVWSPDQCDEIPDEWVNVICGTECPTGA